MSEGRFADHDDPRLTGALEAAVARMDRAVEACRSADEQIVGATMHLLALRARVAHPEALTLCLCWSDQGDFLDVSGLQGSDGAQIDWFDHEGLAWNLTGAVESSWLPFVQASDKDPCMASFRLPIQPTLEHFDLMYDEPLS